MARSDLYFFSRYMFRQRQDYRWQQAMHHPIISQYLMAVYDGRIKRLIINIPPRYSKTLLAIINFIAWGFGKCPDAEFLHASYSAELAIRNAWEVRDLVQDPEYQMIFPSVRVRLDSSAVNRWRTTAGGMLYASGMAGAITGFGGGKMRPGFSGALLIDDPHKADEATSPTQRRNVINWFQNTLLSRANSRDTPIILIMQRLHEEDLSGWLLAGGNGEEWTHLCLPALLENGTALWPAKHTVEDLHRMEKAMPWTFAGQYQQKPSPREGGMFKAARIPIIDAVPVDVIRWVRGWDFASSKAADADYTASALLGELPGNRYVVADVQRLRGSPDEVEALLVQTAKIDPKRTLISIPKDPGQAAETQVRYLTGKLRGFHVKNSRESGDKATRAEPFAAQCNVGNVSIVKGAWTKELLDELGLFPNGAHDDQVDALSRAFGEMVSNKIEVRVVGGKPIDKPLYRPAESKVNR